MQKKEKNKSFYERVANKLKMNSRRGNIDVDNVVSIAMALIFGAIVVAVGLFVLAVIFGLPIFQGVGTAINLSNNVSFMTVQITSFIINFFAFLPIAGTILGVVLLIGGILILVFKVVAMKNSTSTRMTG